MNDNLYAPPKSPVSDIEPAATDESIGSRPRAVTIAVIMIGLSFVVGFVGRSLVTGRARLAGYVVGVAVVAGITFLLLRALYRGRNWVRWFFVISVAFGLVMARYSLARMLESWRQDIYVFQAILQAIAVILLLLPASNKWFTRNRKR